MYFYVLDLYSKYCSLSTCHYVGEILQMAHCHCHSFILTDHSVLLSEYYHLSILLLDIGAFQFESIMNCVLWTF